MMSDDYMCPFCVTPWKCNGPHIDEVDLPEFMSYVTTVRRTALEEVRQIIEVLHPRCEEACEMCADWDDLVKVVDPLIAAVSDDAHPDQFREDYTPSKTEHDPLCGWTTLGDCFPAEDCGECALISRVRGDFLHKAERVINDRIADLKSCSKSDDCQTIAYGAELALDDLAESHRQTVG